MTTTELTTICDEVLRLDAAAKAKWELGSSFYAHAGTAAPHSPEKCSV